MAKVPYAIPIDDFGVNGNIAASDTATTTPSITIGPYPFVWEKLVIYIFDTDDTGSDATDDIDIDKIRDQGASVNFLKDSTHVNTLRQGDTGGDNEWVLSNPYQFKRHSSISIQVTNNDSSKKAKMELAFHGYLIME